MYTSPDAKKYVSHAVDEQCVFTQLALHLYLPKNREVAQPRKLGIRAAGRLKLLERDLTSCLTASRFFCCTPQKPQRLNSALASCGSSRTWDPLEDVRVAGWARGAWVISGS